MRLFIAEKPSVARAIANELGLTGKEEGFLCCGTDKVTWCFGHLLTFAEPDFYTPDDAPVNPKTKKKLWRVEDLPIIPSQWKIIPKDGAQKQLKQIAKLIKEASVIVNAGDADREGQLLVDEILDYFNNSKPVLRFWVAAHDSTSLKRGLSSLKDNQSYVGLGQAALARSQADWLIGMNLSRAYTLNASKNGSRALVTVGRVQTPTLKLVVDRDREVALFESKPFYNIKLEIIYNNQLINCDWSVSEHSTGLDAEGRLIDLSLANAIVDKVQNQVGVVSSYKSESLVKHHPKAYSLSDLTLEASNRYGFSASEILNACQSLYETHKLTSYPRTDCSFLPESQHADAKEVLDALLIVNPECHEIIKKADPSIKSKTWNDNKVTVHYGIIPTMHRGSKSQLSDSETKIYELIVRRYIAQFYPNHDYNSTLIEFHVGAELFVAKGNTVLNPGWCEVYKHTDELNNGNEQHQILPILQEGEEVTCRQASRIDAKTTPPAHFSEGTLQRAMENIHKIIKEEEHKTLLKEGDGLGTPATRASIISELKNRGFLEAKGKRIVSTELGQRLIDTLPETVKSPVLTALFERVLKAIENNPSQRGPFIEKQADFVKEQVKTAASRAIKLPGNPAFPPLSEFLCHCCKKNLIRRTGKKGYWWSCSAYPDCRQTYKDNKGKPLYNE